LSIICLASCSVTNKSFTKDIKIVEDAYSEVFSPEKKFYLKMYGDYAITNKMNRKEFQNTSEIIKQLSLKMNIRHSFLLKGATIVSPFYKNMIFMDNVFNRDTMFHHRGILQDRDGKPVYYYLQENSGKRFLFLSYIVQNTEENIIFSESSFEHENDEMINTLTFNTFYKLPIPSEPFGTTQPLYQNEMDTLNYIRPVQWLKSHCELYDNDKQSYWAFIQSALTYAANIKQLPLYNVYLEKWYKMTQQKTDRKYLSTSFFDTISFVADNHDILIFNENHFTPKHRILMTSLLEDLYHQGYRNLALEALFSEDDAFSERKCVLVKDGFYTREPEMANLIHEAIQLGYHVINYEADEVTATEREQKQAENLWNKIKNNDNKTIVLCGAGHIALNPKMSKMAYVLKQLSDKRIFTINQMAFDCLIPDFNKEQVKIINSLAIIKTQSPDTILLQRNQNDLYVVNNLTYPKVVQFKHKAVNVKNIIPKKFNKEPFVFVYREKDYRQYGAACIPFSIYFLSGKAFDFFIPANEPTLILIKDWQNDIVHSVVVE
jgi:hypothetical protein